MDMPEAAPLGGVRKASWPNSQTTSCKGQGAAALLWASPRVVWLYGDLKETWTGTDFLTHELKNTHIKKITITKGFLGKSCFPVDTEWEAGLNRKQLTLAFSGTGISWVTNKPNLPFAENQKYLDHIPPAHKHQGQDPCNNSNVIMLSCSSFILSFLQARRQRNTEAKTESNPGTKDQSPQQPLSTGPIKNLFMLMELFLFLVWAVLPTPGPHWYFLTLLFYWQIRKLSRNVTFLL